MFLFDKGRPRSRNKQEYTGKGNAYPGIHQNSHPVEIIDPWNLRRREVIEKGFLNYGDGPFAKIIDALKDYEKRNSGRDLVSDQIVPGNQDSYITELQRLKDALKRKSEGKSTSEETSEWLKDWAEAEENGC